MANDLYLPIAINRTNSLTISSLFLGNIIDDVKKNGIVWGKVTKILPHSGLLIELPGYKCGFAHVTELYDEYRDNPLEEFKIKSFVK